MTTQNRTIAVAVLIISLCPVLQSFSQSEPSVATSAGELANSHELASISVVPRPDGAPAWYRGAFQMGGQWLTNPPAWFVPAEAPDGEGSLFIVLDRSVLTNDLTMELRYLDKEGSSLYVDLLATNCVTVGTNLYGNLIEGTNEIACVELPIALAKYPDAAIIRLWRGVGTILVYESQLTIAGISRGEESENGNYGRQSLSISATSASVVMRNSGSSFLSQSQWQMSRVVSQVSYRMIHVDAKTGDDACDGRALTRSGTSGPKRTIPGALNIAEDGDAITVAPGTYDGNVSFCGKNVDVFMTGDVTLQ